MTQTHVFFIDDSGTKEYAATPDGYDIRGRGVSRYFVFCGVLVSMRTSGVLSSEIIQAKLRHFRDDTVEIKSNWLRIPHERENRYLKPYSMTESDLQKFTDEIYKIIDASDLMLIASVIDKVQMVERYPRLWYPPAAAYETLILRVQQQLGSTEKVAVIIDDTTGKTPKGNDYKKNLQRHHEKLRKYGSSLWRGSKFPGLTTQKFVNSQISNLVQIADLCAYNVHRQFQEYGDEWEAPGCETLPLYDHFRRVHKKFRQSPSGQIQGWGIVKMPERNKKRWTLAKEKPVP